MIAVRVVFDDGSQEERTWSMADFDGGAPAPTVDLQDWMVDPRRSWEHPQDPITHSTLVAPGREDEARAWLAGLGVGVAPQ